MPYSQGTRLPGESASKLGHLSVIESEWVNSLINDFEYPKAQIADPSNTLWTEFNSLSAEPLRNVWAVDGSFVSVSSDGFPSRELSFVKTALLTMDRAKIDTIDKEHPHPLHLQDVMTGSAIFHATVFPLRNIRTSLGSNYEAIRNIIKDSVKVDENGIFYETLKWIVYQKWSSVPTNSPSFGCPHCMADIQGLPVDADRGHCGECHKEVFLTDMIGFHLDMDEDSAPESVPSAYMLIMELLMLFTVIRLLWHHTDKSQLSDTLFIKDGPLTLRSQYSKLVPSLRDFLEHAKNVGRPIHIIGQEKSGVFFDHLSTIARFTSPKERNDKLHYAVLSHDYVRKEVYRMPDLSHPYGKRTNWGEKMYVKFDPHTYMVLNIPTGAYNEENSFPSSEDLIGLERILTTLPSLISHKHEGALFPIELANGIASMSSYPSSKILQKFSQFPDGK
ncbi:hypothetical protein FE784_40105 [Paenibacillus hemerocallicola]|uniref:NurA domain-containing protein n=1 Tax=Paenibacillus hemerocallicola TaxID=1172614 RepID=A0A5C4SVT7_9BACL|nr:hypothetical protein [Paenibacillus hemerocallicola]TNJ54098.1 hypothetical protein FE784_40105 [Paenibacillus hemerocallicola]